MSWAAKAGASTPELPDVEGVKRVLARNALRKTIAHAGRAQPRRRLRAVCRVNPKTFLLPQRKKGAQLPRLPITVEDHQDWWSNRLVAVDAAKTADYGCASQLLRRFSGAARGGPA